MQAGDPADLAAFRRDVDAARRPLVGATADLRTALAAWGFARATGRRFLLRVEDLDRVKQGATERNVADLRAIGLDWDGPVDLQSERIPLFLERVRTLTDAGLTYECFCTRREIHAAASAPHGIPGAYPGTCRNLTEEQRARRRTERPPAVRLRAGVREFTVHDRFNQVDDKLNYGLRLRGSVVWSGDTRPIPEMLARHADAVVVGSAIVDLIGNAHGRKSNDIPGEVEQFVSTLSQAVRTARPEAVLTEIGA